MNKDKQVGTVAKVVSNEMQAANKAASTDSDAAHTVNLALQGGGSHGAYTWGVIDALLQDGRLSFEGITGASAGALNAALLAHGWQQGLDKQRDPRESARESLAGFWQAVGRQTSAFNTAPGFTAALAPWTKAMQWWGPAPRSLDKNPMFIWMDLVSRLFSPYQLNPFNFNPLRDLLHQRVDCERLRAQSPFKLFLCATDVRSGRPRIFREHELVPDMLLASTCLPYAFQAVEIEGQCYWDGGYMGNPALWPLFYTTQCCDLLLVQINPLRREEVPDTAPEIAERINEISFNASLMHELRAIEFVQRLLAQDKLDPQRYRSIRLHMASAEQELSHYGASSKYNTAPDFIDELFQLGQRTGAEWLDSNWAYVGHRSSVRIADVFL